MEQTEKRFSRGVSLIVAGVSLFGLLSGASIAQAEEFRVVANLNLSGKDGNIGVDIKNGIELARDQLDAAGGLVIEDKKYDLKVIYADHKGDLTKAGQQTLQQIMRYKAVAVLPSFNEEEVVQDARITHGLKTPLVATWISEPKVVKNRPYSFKVIGDYDSEAKAMVTFAKEDLNAKKIAILYNERDRYSTDAAKAIEHFFIEDYGEDSVHSVGFASQDEIGNKLEELLATDAQFLYLPLDQYETPMAIQKAHELDWNKPITGTSYWIGEELVKSCGELCEGTHITGWFATKGGGPAMVKFVTDYQEKYGSLPNEAAATGYDAFNVVAKGLQQLKGIDAKNVQDVREKLKKAIASTKHDGVTGSMEYDGNGEPVKCVTMSKYAAGNFEFEKSVCQ